MNVHVYACVTPSACIRMRVRICSYACVQVYKLHVCMPVCACSRLPLEGEPALLLGAGWERGVGGSFSLPHRLGGGRKKIPQGRESEGRNQQAPVVPWQGPRPSPARLLVGWVGLQEPLVGRLVRLPSCGFCLKKYTFQTQ